MSKLKIELVFWTVFTVTYYVITFMFKLGFSYVAFICLFLSYLWQYRTKSVKSRVFERLIICIIIIFSIGYSAVIEEKTPKQHYSSIEILIMLGFPLIFCLADSVIHRKHFSMDDISSSSTPGDFNFFTDSVCPYCFNKIALFTRKCPHCTANLK